MTLIIIRMNVFPEKRMELSQTISSLFVSTRMQQGCRCCDFYQSVEDENRLVLLEEWDNKKDFMTHLKSDNFKVIREQGTFSKNPMRRRSTPFPPDGNGGATHLRIAFEYFFL